MTTPIDEQHLKYLQRQAERAVFMYASLETRAKWTKSEEVKAYIQELITLVDEQYPKEPLWVEEVVQ